MAVVHEIDQDFRDTVNSLIRRRIDRSQQFLLTVQRDNGSWLNSPWHTAKIVMALVETGLRPTHPQVLNAYRWLTQEAAMHVSGEVCWDSWTWDTALVIRALHRMHSEEAESYIQRASSWLKREERTEVESPSSLLSFGRCYSAQVILALVEVGEDVADIGFFANHLKSLQERDGGWISTFDTAQILEALVASGGAEQPTQWIVKHAETGEEYPGGIDVAISWVERRQLIYGNWDGLTWPTAWILRAYLLAASRYNRETVMLALSWLLEQKAPDGSWFHEPARTATCMLTFNKVLDLKSKLHQNGIDLDQSYSRFLVTASNLRRETLEKTRSSGMISKTEPQEHPNGKAVERKNLRNILDSLRKWLGSE